MLLTTLRLSAKMFFPQPNGLLRFSGSGLNGFPEKVPEKVLGGFGANVGSISTGLPRRFRRRFGRLWRRTTSGSTEFRITVLEQLAETVYRRFWRRATSDSTGLQRKFQRRSGILWCVHDPAVVARNGDVALEKGSTDAASISESIFRSKRYIILNCSIVQTFCMTYTSFVQTFCTCIGFSCVRACLLRPQFSLLGQSRLWQEKISLSDPWLFPLSDKH